MTAADSRDAAARATRGLQGVSTELAERVTQLLEAMRSIGESLDLSTTLDSIAETAAELTDARYASIVVIDEASGDLDEFASYGVDQVDRARIDEIPDTPGCTLTVPIVVDDRNFGDIVLSQKGDGGAFTGHDVTMIRVIATEAGIAIGNARRYREARQRERWIHGANAVTTALLSSPDAHDALEVIAEQARTLADAAAGIVLLPREGGGGLEVSAAAGGRTAVEGLTGTVVPSYSSVVAQLLAGEAVFVDDGASDPRMVTEMAARFGPAMLLPLRSGERVLGTLALPRAVGAPQYEEAEKQLAIQFAGQAALALVLAEAQRDRERLAVYEDRDRIARDLHDLVIQRLFATGMQLQGAYRHTEAEEARGRIDQAIGSLEVTVEEIRASIYALQQEPEQSPAGLRALVLREVATAAAPLGFEPATEFAGPVDELLEERLTRHLLAALREGLSNAYRHAGASRLRVAVDAAARLPDGRRAVRLTVADDGRGLGEGGRRSGLRNLERRAEELGGRALYGPGIGESGAGTSMIWEVPLSGGGAAGS